MVMALGIGAWTAAFFHLFTHAFFKACLFLGSGSVSHAVHSFDMKKDMGGLRKWMPQTYKTFIIGTAALIGIFPLAGFWSKDEILAGASQLGGSGHYTGFMIIGIVGALMTAAYMTRVIYLTFFGEYRGHGHPHESGPRITVPLWILAVLGVTAGFANIPAALGPDAVELRFEHFYEPRAPYFPIENFTHPEFSLGIALGATLIGVIGIGSAYLWYWRGLGPHGITQRNRVARAGYTVLENKYYFDKLYEGVIVGRVQGPDRPGRLLVQPERHRRRGQRRRTPLHRRGPLRLQPHRPAGGRRRGQQLGLRRQQQRPGLPPAHLRQGPAVRGAPLRGGRHLRRRHHHLRLTATAKGSRVPIWTTTSS